MFVGRDDRVGHVAPREERVAHADAPRERARPDAEELSVRVHVGATETAGTFGHVVRDPGDERVERRGLDRERRRREQPVGRPREERTDEAAPRARALGREPAGAASNTSSLATSVWNAVSVVV